jgi:hypothetical protein
MGKAKVRQLIRRICVHSFRDPSTNTNIRIVANIGILILLTLNSRNSVSTWERQEWKFVSLLRYKSLLICSKSGYEDTDYFQLKRIIHFPISEHVFVV